jgi:hypothetical protein
MPTPVTVSACDNELYIIATQGAGSSELLHIKSGYGAPVSNTFNLENILPKGTWQITLVGINWGGPWAFKVKVGTNNYTPTGTGTIGVVWQATTPPITI